MAVAAQLQFLNIRDVHVVQLLYTTLRAVHTYKYVVRKFLHKIIQLYCVHCCTTFNLPRYLVVCHQILV